MHRAKWLIALLIFAVMVASFPAVAAKDNDLEAEKKLGKETAAEIDKTLKFITDEKYKKRVDEIGKKISDIAKTVKVTATYGNDELADFAYTFKIIDDKEVNAAALPAGYIYINKGLLDSVESDDELAGVIAHEVAHVAHHHLVALLKKQGQYNAYMFAIFAAAMLSKSQDVQNIFNGAQLFQIAKMNAYTQEAEEDADRTAIEYMIRAGYNPVGMLTFIEKLAREDAYNPIDLGVFRTHPLTRNRASYIISELKRRNIPINRRLVTSEGKAFVKEIIDGEKMISLVVIGNKVIFKPADIPNSSSANRAKAIAEALNSALDLNPGIRDVKLGHDGITVYVKDKLIVEVQQNDAELESTTKEALATTVKEAIQSILVAESLKLMY